MTSTFRTLLILCLGLSLLGMTSGCSYFDKKRSSDKRFNHYEPYIVVAIGNTITVKYLDVNSLAQPDQALDLIIDHCNGSYTESDRQTTSGWTTIEAECA